jgi:amino acid adenylation domain-containing protein
VQTLVELFTRTVNRYPNRRAVSDGQEAVTYEQLDARSDGLARELIRRGVTGEDRVAIHRPRSAETFVAMLGVLKAGAAYVAVDVRYPQPRRDAMLTGSEARLIITEPGGADRFSRLGIDVLEWRSGLDAETGPHVESAETIAHTPELTSANAACVLFTSGSTGIPKAFVLEHGNLVLFATNPALPELLCTDRMSQIASNSFDAFHYETWCCFTSGAELVVMPSMPELLASDLGDELRKRDISVMIAPTMAFNHLSHEDPGVFSSLRVLQVGGGTMLPSACRDLLASDFAGTLWNLYGPAETTTGCTVHHVAEVGDEDESVPIGRPMEGFSIYVLDNDKKPVLPGEVGELHVGGPGVSRGYLNRPDENSRRFLPNPFAGGRMYASGDLVRERPDGIYEFVGRADEQVKVRGYRVEPGEIECAVARHPLVREVVVLPAGEGLDTQLVAFVAAGDGLTAKAVRQHAEQMLPDFMIPSLFMMVSEIPGNESGKRNREALRELLDAERRRRAGYRPPAPGTETYLADLWEKYLGVENIGASDRFMSMGGNSLLVFRVRRRIQQDLGVAIGFRTLLDDVDLEALAKKIDGQRAAEARTET